jgi:3-hydroxy-9,10-secoandrosta-1,3,5(10)-triene-9,17-dione monooxygenase
MTAVEVSTLDAVRELVPTLRETGPKTEAARSVLPENIDLMEQAGVFRMTVPRRFGGLEQSVADQVAVHVELARGCSATGWVAMIWSAASWVPTLFPDRTQEEVFANGTVRISAGFAPTGKLTPVDGGYRLNGTWKWMSGCQGAHWYNVAALSTDPDAPPAPFTALVPHTELSIVDDWYTTAAAGTGSATVVAKDVFVPAHRVASMIDLLSTGTPDRANKGGDYALVPYFMATAAAVYLGMAKGAYDLFMARIPGRGITYTSWTDQRQSPLTQIQVATAANKIAAAEAMSADWLTLIQARADENAQPTVEERATVRGQVGYAIQLCKEAVEVLHSAAGASVIHRDVPFQRFYRDITGLSLHALFTPNTNLELHGRVLLGLPPDTPFL